MKNAPLIYRFNTQYPACPGSTIYLSNLQKKKHNLNDLTKLFKTNQLSTCNTFKYVLINKPCEGLQSEKKQGKLRLLPHFDAFCKPSIGKIRAVRGAMEDATNVLAPGPQYDPWRQKRHAEHKIQT